MAGKWISELAVRFNPWFPVSLEAFVDLLLSTRMTLPSDGSVDAFLAEFPKSTAVAPPAASGAFKAQPRSGKWNIPFHLDIYQIGLKAGFCLTLHSSLLSTAAMSCHPRSRGIIPHQGSCKSPRHAAALSSFRASAGLTRDTRVDQGPPATRAEKWSQQSSVRTAGMDGALVLIAILHIWIIKSWQLQMMLTGYILFRINQSPGSEGAEKLFK